MVLWEERGGGISWRPPAFVTTSCAVLGNWPYGAKECFLSIFTGRLPWEPAGIKFTQCVSGKKNQHFAPAGKTLRWIEKWLTPFRIVTTSCIIVQSLGEIELRAPAVGAKIWCVCVFCRASWDFGSPLVYSDHRSSTVLLWPNCLYRWRL